MIFATPIHFDKLDLVPHRLRMEWPREIYRIGDGLIVGGYYFVNCRIFRMRGENK